LNAKEMTTRRSQKEALFVYIGYGIGETPALTYAEVDTRLPTARMWSREARGVTVIRGNLRETAWAAC
jgi:hypothetical protein